MNDYKQDVGFPTDFFSACIIAKNEEKNIGRCLKCLCRLGIEVVVVDTGSTDRTREIALKYTPYVYEFVWCNDFSAAKNYAISKATGPFIMNIDCDEFVEVYDLNQLYQVLSRQPERVGRIKIKNVIHNHGQKMVREEWVSRIFSKEMYQFEGRIHEQITPKDGTSFSTFQAPVEVLHTGYDLSEEDRTLKAKRNIHLLLLEKQQLEISNEQDKLPYILYQLGKAHYLEHSYQEACNYFSQGLSFDLDTKLEYVIDMVETYGYALVNAGMASEALFFENIYEAFGKTSDFHFLMGIIYMNNELFEQAIEEFLKATKYTDGRTQGVNSYIAFYNIGVIYECTGDVKQALKYFGLAGDYQPAKDGIERLRE